MAGTNNVNTLPSLSIGPTGGIPHPRANTSGAPNPGARIRELLSVVDMFEFE